MTDKKTPLVKFGNEWIPAHELWKKTESMTTAVELLDKFNKNHQHLATDSTLAAVPKVRNRLKNIAFETSSKAIKKDTLPDEVIKLLEDHPMEDVLDMLQQQRNLEINAHGLVLLIGNEAYENVLSKELNELNTHGISPDQIADLWNDLKRPVPTSGGLWTASKIKAML